MSTELLLNRTFWPLLIFYAITIVVDTLLIYFLWSTNRELKDYNENMDYFHEKVSDILTMIENFKKKK